MANKDYEKAASDMLGLRGPKELNEGLRSYLRRTDTYCRRAGTALVSRQLIAAILVQWEHEYGDCRVDELCGEY